MALSRCPAQQVDDLSIPIQTLISINEQRIAPYGLAPLVLSDPDLQLLVPWLCMIF